MCWLPVRELPPSRPINSRLPRIHPPGVFTITPRLARLMLETTEMYIERRRRSVALHVPLYTVECPPLSCGPVLLRPSALAFHLSPFLSLPVRQWLPPGPLCPATAYPTATLPRRERRGWGGFACVRRIAVSTTSLLGRPHSKKVGGETQERVPSPSEQEPRVRERGRRGRRKAPSCVQRRSAVVSSAPGSLPCSESHADVHPYTNLYGDPRVAPNVT